MTAGGGQGGSSGGGGGSVWDGEGYGSCEPDPRSGICRDDYWGVRRVSIDDVRHFPAQPGRAAMQPDGWTIAGLHTNFYAIVGVQEYRGRVLGRSASVRFTPIRYHWNYGDGSTAVRSVKGGTWSSHGVREFERTPTSHVYRRVREYRITLRIEYSAQYRYADDVWRSVLGTLTLPANELRIRVVGADTVLVDRDCLAAPAGPGC